jgi:tetratricopeptide (TPR) repeat protein
LRASRREFSPGRCGRDRLAFHGFLRSLLHITALALALAPAAAAVEGDPGVLAVAPLAEAAAAPDAADTPAPAVRSDGHRSEVEEAWFSAGRDVTARALAARTRALQLGAGNYEAASRALVAPTQGDVDLQRALLAARLAPDLPPARMQLAAAYFEDGQYANVVREGIAALRGIPRNLEALVWLAASLLAMLAAVLTLGSLAFMLWVGASVFRHAAHDLGDLFSKRMPEFARAALLASLLLVPVLRGEALMGLVLGLFGLGFAYCDASHRRALVVAAILFVVGLYPMLRLTGMALSTLQADPVASAALSVTRSMTSPADIQTLARAAGEGDLLAESALALHERRSGDPAAAMARYAKLLEKTPNDPIVLATLANMHFERGENQRALELGERAAGQIRSATLLFNLSKMYARTFRMDEFEGAMAQAQKVDAAVVADLSRTTAPDFIADLAFPLTPIRDRMIRNAQGEGFGEPFVRVLMPGRLGRDWQTTAGTFAGVAVLALLLGGRFDHASRCTRCGSGICNRCDGTVWNSRICDGCHHLFHRPETTDPRRRMARLSELRARELRVGRLAVLASLLVPGVGGLLARRPDLSFLGLFFFGWAAASWQWREGVVADPLAMGDAGPLVFAVAGGLALLAYAVVVLASLSIRRSL